MLKKILLAGVALLGLAACSNNDEPSRSLTLSDGSIKITIENPEKWSAYVARLAEGVEKRAAALLENWETTVADEFKAREADESVQKIIDGCTLTAQTISTGRVDDPMALLVGGYGMQAVAGVEIWFGLHSVSDYAGNVLSIRNVYFGSLTGEATTGSLAATVAALNPEADAKVRRLIGTTLQAVQQSGEGKQLSDAARTSASELAASLVALKPILAGASAADSEAIVATYVDDVVLPTYRRLAPAASNLADLARALAANPGDTTFAAFNQAWTQARAALSLTAAYTL
ncbi:MAG: hypothetical protein K2M40_04980 [Muribaculaceae bacterium]|nr:hypothetical protein [Muribaculaceae bacterium]